MNELGNVVGRPQACLSACMSGLKIWCISLRVNACPCILYVNAGIITARTTNSAILSVTARLRSSLAWDAARSMHIWWTGSMGAVGDDVHAQDAQRFTGRLRS